MTDPTTIETGELVERVRVALAWVGYNAPNESDRLRAFDAMADADDALSTLRSRIEELERERGQALDANAAWKVYADDLKQQVNQLRGNGVKAMTSLQEARGLLERRTTAIENVLCVCTVPCEHLSEMAKQVLRDALSSTKETDG